MDQELFDRFRKCAVEVLSVSEDQVTPEAKFGDDLDADSLDLVELVMALEEEFDIEVPEEELEGIETVGQAYDLVVGKLPDRGPDAAGASPSPASASSPRAASGATRSGHGLLGPGLTDGPYASRSPTGIRRRTTTTPRRPAAPTASSSSRSPRPPRRSTQAGDRGSASTRPGRHDLRHRRRRPAHARGADRASAIEKGERRVSPFLVPMMMANAAGAAISMRYGLQGPCETIATACAAGTHAIGNAARLIAWGRCDAVVTGGTEAAVTTDRRSPAFGNMTALSTVGISRPFDVDRDGFVMGEGAAVLVLEEWEHAVARGATILGEVLGAGSNADAHHITAPSPGGAGAVACMELALADAGLDARRHRARSTPTARRRRSTTPPRPRPSPRCSARPARRSRRPRASPATRSAPPARSRRPPCCCRCEHRLIPPTADTKTSTPTSTSTSSPARPAPWEPGPTMSNNFGFGGHNGSVIIAPALNAGPTSIRPDRRSRRRRRRTAGRTRRRTSPSAPPAVPGRSLAGPGRHPAQLDLELERVAGADLAAEAGAVEAAEQRQLAGEALVGEHGDGADLGDRLAHQHAGQRRPAGEVPGKNHSSPVRRHVPGRRLARHRAR